MIKLVFSFTLHIIPPGGLSLALHFHHDTTISSCAGIFLRGPRQIIIRIAGTRNVVITKKSIVTAS
jgi:hypothetical protein